MKVLALTKYGRVAASSRCRFLNYVPLLAQRDISVTVSPLLSDSYVRRRLSAAPINYADVAGSYISRLSAVINSSRFDALWIEGELLPRWPAIFEKLLSSRGKPFIVDLDDAIFHTYDRHPIRLVRTLLGRKIDAVCNLATLVVAGNEYLAERARRAGARRVVIVPTTVDHRAYAEQQRSSQGKLTFGWIGSAATQHYLETIKPELEELCGAFDIRLRLIGVDRHNLKCPDVVLSEWSEETEIAELTACDVGLAPLYDGYWERGKCGLKAIQYMAAGIPQLAANVGALPSIVRHDETGFLYRNASEFKAFATQLVVDSSLRQRMGIAGRNRVASHYSTHSWTDTVAGILVDAASQSPIDRTGRALFVRASNRAEFSSMDRARQEFRRSIRKRVSRERVVVYTAITGNYDAVVPPPGSKARGFSYVCFSDSSKEIPGWEVRPLGDTPTDPARLSRLPKILPHRFFPDHDISIWIDCRVLIVGNLIEFCEVALRDTDIALFRHGGWRLPDGVGIIPEAGVIIRRHHRPKVRTAMEDWWGELLKHSARDQISLPYIIWRNGLAVTLLDWDLRVSPWFSIPTTTPVGEPGSQCSGAPA